MKCPHCGKEIADRSKFCEFCGRKISAGARSYVWLWVSLCLCLTAVAAAVIVWILAGSNKSDEVVTAQIEESIPSMQMQQETTQKTSTQQSVARQQTSSGNYYVVAGWFQELDNAITYLRNIQDLGYASAFMLDYDFGYRVIATRAPSKSEAASIASRLEREVMHLGTQIKPFVVKGTKKDHSYHLGRINDPDGWSNVRADQSQDSETMLTLDHGTEILYKTTSSGWYEVYDPETYEFYGYVHKSRIR